jgi:hypothetical protein
MPSGSSKPQLPTRSRISTASSMASAMTSSSAFRCCRPAPAWSRVRSTSTSKTRSCARSKQWEI